MRELNGPALDWAVDQIEGGYAKYCASRDADQEVLNWRTWAGASCYSPSTRWANGGPIIDKMYQNGQLLLALGVENECQATFIIGPHIWTAYGPTPLIAAMRCFVASKLGNEVDVPEGLNA